LSERYNAGVMNQNLASAVALAGLARVDDDPHGFAQSTFFFRFGRHIHVPKIRAS
jgi:hypothetical protein